MSAGEMQVRTVDPWDLEISDVNERTEQFNLNDLEQSVREIGVVEPPLVRPAKDGDGYEVVVGQRRTLAAQGELDQIPVIVAPWDDAEALKASISENVDVFRESVSGKDRARALQQLWIAMGGDAGEFPSAAKLADEIGVKTSRVREWIEPLRPEWKGTPVDPNHVSNESDLGGPDTSVNVEKVGETTLRKVRTATEDTESALELVKEVESGELTRDDVKQVGKQTRRGADTEKAVETVKEAKSGPAQMRLSFYVSGEPRLALEEAAKEHATTEEELAREAIEDYLESEGYL